MWILVGGHQVIESGERIIYEMGNLLEVDDLIAASHSLSHLSIFCVILVIS
jgi:hypothetical protein